MTLTQRFLKAKHWQLFLLVIGLPFTFQFVLIGTMFLSFAREGGPDPDFMIDYFKFFPLIMMLVGSILFGWLWSIGIGLQNKLPVTTKMKTNQFKIFFFIPIGYLFCIGIALIGMSELFENGGQPNFGLIGSAVAIIFPLHLFSIFCMLHSIYFIAKTIKTVELQRETTFSDFAGEFFLIWFYPIGIWIVQPKVNTMVESD